MLKSAIRHTSRRKPHLPTAPLDIQWLGREPHGVTWQRQRDLLIAIRDGLAPDTLLVVEHDPIITLGRKKNANANVHGSCNVPVQAIERGGDATYHGPGQIVAYPLLRLLPHERDLHAHLRRLEGWIITLLGTYAITANRHPQLTGVWVGSSKIASVGIAVSHWVTYHGLALNVSTDLQAFHMLNPCGLDATVMTSLNHITGCNHALDDVVDRLIQLAPAALQRQSSHLCTQSNQTYGCTT
jgi:lipoate-protein ligase B